MPGPHKGVSTQHHNQQVLAKPRHQPLERDQQARERLRHKAKIKSCTYVQLGISHILKYLSFTYIHKRRKNITNCISNICT